MSTQGYTRRDHRHRKRRSKSRNEMLLDKLLKIFFYILVILVVIILIKIVFFKDKDDNKDGGKPSNISTENKTEEGSSSIDDTTSVDDTTGTSETPEETTTQEVTTEEPTTEEVTTEEPTEEPTTEEQTPAPPPYIPTGNYTVFDDAAFCGDSRIGGLYLSSQLTTSTFYYDVGGNVSNAVDGDGYTLDNGASGSLLAALRQREFEYVFVQFGVNEWGWDTNTFVARYKSLLQEIKAIQPNAKVYVLAIIPVTQSFDDARVEDVNASLTAKDNGIKAAVESIGVGYINIVEGLTGGTRVLGENMSTDGYHLNRTENLKVLDYICEAIK